MNKAWIILWSLVAIFGLVGMITEGINCFLMFGIALSFVIGEIWEYSSEKRKAEKAKHRQAK